MANKIICASALIERFRYMYDQGWGYIWGTSGQKWTEAKQKAATRDMTVKYGSKWIGHHVVDCSGAFVWAFKQEGGSIYHGSNTIFNKYCTSKGKLINGIREDGEPIKPGTAVFLVEDNKRYHIGLYVGGDLCIESKGTINGVVISKLTHWDEWGELKDVDYSGVQPVDITSIPRTLRQPCKGNDVKELQTMLESLGYSVGEIDGIFGNRTRAAVLEFQNDHGLKADGIVGERTMRALQDAVSVQEKKYTVSITGISAEQVASLCDLLSETYPSLSVTEEA